jgi:hypothetical protein
LYLASRISHLVSRISHLVSRISHLASHIRHPKSHPSRHALASAILKPMTPQAVKDYFRKQIADAQNDYVKDLDALSEEQLASTPGGAARSPYDFTFELVFVNRRIAQRLRGETPAPASNDDGWMKAPESFRSKETAKKEVAETMDEILKAWDNLDPANLQTPIKLPNGNETSAIDMASLAARHAGYHDAQLNYLQAMHGDEKVHWN